MDSRLTDTQLHLRDKGLNFQQVRRVLDSAHCAARGQQHGIWINDNEFWVAGPADQADSLIERYLRFLKEITQQ